MSYWQVQDKVNKEVITTCTDDCDRPDCIISARVGETTCAGTSDHYDRNGILHVDDSNRKDVKVCCRTCWRHWNVTQKWSAHWPDPDRKIAYTAAEYKPIPKSN